MQEGHVKYQILMRLALLGISAPFDNMRSKQRWHGDPFQMQLLIPIGRAPGLHHGDAGKTSVPHHHHRPLFLVPIQDPYLFEVGRPLLQRDPKSCCPQDAAVGDW